MRDTYLLTYLLTYLSPAGQTRVVSANRLHHANTFEMLLARANKLKFLNSFLPFFAYDIIVRPSINNSIILYESSH